MNFFYKLFKIYTAPAQDSSVPFDKEAITVMILGMWKQLVVYLAIALIIGVYWVAHVMTFTIIQAADSAIGYLNVMFLLLLSCLPFTITILSQNFYFYGLLINNVVLALLGIVLLIIWVYATWKYVKR